MNHHQRRKEKLSGYVSPILSLSLSLSLSISLSPSLPDFNSSPPPNTQPVRFMKDVKTIEQNKKKETQFFVKFKDNKSYTYEAKSPEIASA